MSLFLRDTILMINTFYYLILSLNKHVIYIEVSRKNLLSPTYFKLKTS